MAVTEERSASKVWRVGVRQVVYMALGAALYAGLTLPTNLLPVPSAGNVSLRPAIVIPLFFGVVFGPVVGFFAGAIGNTISDLISGYGIVWFWELGNGILGLIAGLAFYWTWGYYRSTRNIVIAEIFSAVGIVVGLGIAAYSDIWVYKLSVAGATSELVAAGGTDLVNGLILLPILLVVYNAAMRRVGRG
ncbi:MAG TPA: ECF transporter S component [Ktedonobacteraceae bacterium]|nr:ECF transporter S component [Ktedonobacteraceae bacterium]